MSIKGALEILVTIGTYPKCLTLQKNLYGDRHDSSLQLHNKKASFAQDQCSHKYALFGLEIPYSERGGHCERKSRDF